MTFGARLRRYLPAFLRPGDAVTEAITDGVGEALQELVDEAKLLRARGAANRFSGLFTDYYAGAEREDDVARLGMSRLLSKRSNESWAEYETRIAEFTGLEVWDGTRANFTVTGDVGQWGTITGLIREIERTGLVVDDSYMTRDDPLAWKMTPMGEQGMDDSQILEIAEPDPPGQRLTKIFTIGEWLWGFWIELTNPTPVTFLAEEVRTIIRDVKPAWVRCYVLFPGASDWEVVD